MNAAPTLGVRIGATMPNRLINETSPYLLQHAHNPVDWYSWGEEALKAAKEQDKPIFLSIGYSACHWCHVMERESFENEEIAAIMNEHYINIKLDKAGGLTGALEMQRSAEKRNLGVMVGCMLGTSLAMAPAMILAGRAKYVDLDGPLLLSDDYESALKIDGSNIYPPEAALWG